MNTQGPCPSQPTAPKLVLNLHDISCARLSQDHPGEIRWLCLEDPARFAGGLVESLEGTFFDVARKVVIRREKGRTEMFAWSAPTPPSLSDLLNFESTPQQN